MPSNHLILCHPLLLLPSIFPSIRVFSSESALRIRWPKYWSFSFSISPSNEYSGLISFRIDWFDLLAVQGTLTSLLQHHSSKVSILWHSTFLRSQVNDNSETIYNFSERINQLGLKYWFFFPHSFFFLYTTGHYICLSLGTAPIVRKSIAFLFIHLLMDI